LVDGVHVLHGELVQVRRGGRIPHALQSGPSAAPPG
jgi:hypothetical protein